MTAQHRFLDRTGWLPGPWDNEPDREDWIDPATSYPCVIRRAPAGSLCGYVGIPETHPWHGLNYDDILELDSDDDTPAYLIRVNVHGGLTWANPQWIDGHEGDRVGVFHDDHPDAWWFGFDCALYGDFRPAHSRRFAELGLQVPGEVYRDWGWVRAETTDLALQLARGGAEDLVAAGDRDPVLRLIVDGLTPAQAVEAAEALELTRSAS